LNRIHYLTGLPRSGNTVLSALLNQNPRIYSSSLSPLPHVVHSVTTTMLNSQDFSRNPDKTRYSALLKGLYSSYYQDVKKPVIFDRSKHLFAPTMIETLTEHIEPSPKIVYTVRPTLEILASYLTLEHEHPVFVPLMTQENFFQLTYESVDEAVCDYLMQVVLPSFFFQVNRALEPAYRDFVLFINYRDLVTKPSETLERIYEFIKEPVYTHNTDSIMKLEEDRDELVGSHPNLHHVRPNLQYSTVNYREVLPVSIQKRYSGFDFWEEELRYV
jgi:sulfotransferase